MPNKNYIKGRRKEYKILNGAKERGWIGLRTAGSHGFADLVLIDIEGKQIKFVQCKPKSISKNAKQKILEQWKAITGKFVVDFYVI